MNALHAPPPHVNNLPEENGSERPLVSIIVPTYGRASKIRRALSSIQDQGYQNIEIVVVDDNGPGTAREETLKAIRISSSDLPIIIVNTTGKVGGGRARNLGVKACSGSYLAFLDDDDEFLPGKISDQLAFMLENRLDLSYQDVIWMNENGRVIEFRRLDHARNYSQSELLRAHMVVPIAPTAIYMIRRDFFLTTEGFGEVPVGQDWFLMLRCIEANGNIKYMPGAYVRQYLHDDERISTGQKKINGENTLYSIRKQYFAVLSARDRRFIRFRHYAVLAFASARSGFVFNAIKHGLIAATLSPFATIREGYQYYRGRTKQKQIIA